jgi:hypothetical protein
MQLNTGRYNLAPVKNPAAKVKKYLIPAKNIFLKSTRKMVIVPY